MIDLIASTIALEGEHITQLLEFLTKIVVLVLAPFVTWWVWQARAHAKKANEAVNDTHKRKTSNGEPAKDIYTMVAHIYEENARQKDFREEYKGGPLDTGEKVEQFVAETRNGIVELKDGCEKINEKLSVHEKLIKKHACPVSLGILRPEECGVGVAPEA